MSNLGDEPDRLGEIKRLDETIDNSLRQYRIWLGTQLASSAIVAVSGVFTGLAGKAALVEGSPSPWYATATALIVYGIIGALVTTLNQVINPGARQARHHQTKFACHLIKGALEVGSINAAQSNRLWGSAITNPDKAIEELHSMTMTKP